MREPQFGRVEFDGRRRSLPTGVERVADDRVPEVCEVRADLMGAAGVQGDRKQGLVGSPLEDPPVRDRRFAGIDHGAPVVERGITTEWCVESAGIADHGTLDERVVLPSDRPAREQPTDRVVNRGSFGHGDEPVRGAVESVGRIRSPRGPRVTRPRTCVPQQRVDQRVPAVRADGVDVHAGRLVADDEIVILVRDGDRVVERHQRILDRADEAHDVTREYLVGYPAAAAVDGDATLRDERSDLADRHGHEMGLREIDQPHRLRAVGHHETVDDGRLRSCAGETPRSSTSATTLSGSRPRAVRDRAGEARHPRGIGR